MRTGIEVSTDVSGDLLVVDPLLQATAVNVFKIGIAWLAEVSSGGLILHVHREDTRILVLAEGIDANLLSGATPIMDLPWRSRCCTSRRKGSVPHDNGLRMEALRERLGKFGLQLHPDKTRLAASLMSCRWFAAHESINLSTDGRDQPAHATAAQNSKVSSVLDFASTCAITCGRNAV
jgi:hypothetical protein